MLTVTDAEDVVIDVSAYNTFRRSGTSPLSPPHSPLAIVTLFLISMSLVIFCLLFSFVNYVPVKGGLYGICPSLPGLFHLA